MSDQTIKDAVIKIETVKKQAEDILNQYGPDVRAKMDDGTEMKFRLFRPSSGDICYFLKKSRKRGFRLPFHQIDSIKPIIHKKSPEQKWKHGWEKVIACLEKSGLWDNVIVEIKTALQIGYNKLQEAYNDYWNIEKDEFKNKYPELVKINDMGEKYIDTSILWSYSKTPKIKKMRFTNDRFSKDRNEEILKTIQKKMDAKESFSTSGRSSYDVSFEYNAEKNKAWYSEEFKGCANGHYYLAINATHAIFYEDD